MDVKTSDIVSKHYIYSLHGCKEINNNALLKKALKEACISAGATIVGEVEHEFTPQGYTCAFILAESHASIHAYPEHNFAYADFFFCGKAIPELFQETLFTHLRPAYHTSQFIDRSEHIS